MDDKILNSLEQFRDSLTLFDGSKVTLTHIAKVKNYDGSTTVRLSLDREGDDYGTLEEGLPIYLGAGYPQVLVLPADCVYQKNIGDDEPWYVRQVTEDGLLVGEKVVQVTYSDGSQVIVSGVEEGQWFDSGYKR